jgi:Zn-dependent oligopeptidase
MPTLLEQVSDLSTWCKEAEDASIGASWVEFGSEAGLPLPEDEENLKIYSKKQEQLSKLLLFLMENSFIPREQIPDILYFDAIANKQKSKTAEILKNIREARKKQIDISGYHVSVDSWRQFNLQHLKEPELRDKVFDGIIQYAEKDIGPLVQQFFNLVRENYSSHGLDTLSVYCKLARTSAGELKDVVDKSGNYAKKPFLEMAQTLWPKIIGREVNSKDDLYVWRPNAFKEFDPLFKGTEPMKLFLDIMEELKMNTFLRYVTIDDRERQGKHASPACFFIQVPTVGKVIFQKSTPFADATTGFHEGGHGVHFSSINPNAPYWDKYLIHTTTAEIPSTLFESIATDTSFLRDRLGINQENIERIHEMERFLELYYLTFYAANSIMKIEFWEKNLDVEKATERYAELTERYGLPLPGNYWLAHHVMSMYDLYSPSYLLSKIRTASLLHKLRDEHGEKWYGEPNAGKYLREEVFGPGAAVKLENFSSLDPTHYFKDFSLI